MIRTAKPEASKAKHGAWSTGLRQAVAAKAAD